MSRDFDERYPRFHIGPYDRVIIEGVAFTLVDQTAEAFILAPAEGGGLPQTFPLPHLNRLNAAGKVRHEPEHFLPAHKRRAASRRSGAFQVSLLSPEHKGRLERSCAASLRSCRSRAADIRTVEGSAIRARPPRMRWRSFESRRKDQ